MELLLLANRISSYILIGIAILACIALVAESLPEVHAKVIVIPTLILIISWTVFFMILLRRNKDAK